MQADNTSSSQFDTEEEAKEFVESEKPTERAMPGPTVNHCALINRTRQEQLDNDDDSEEEEEQVDLAEVQDRVNELKLSMGDKRRAIQRRLVSSAHSFNPAPTRDKLRRRVKPLSEDLSARFFKQGP